MAMVMDQHQQQQQPQQQQQQQQQTYKHYCRICKKGFGCGRALGGHMRAHGINDVETAGHADAEDDPSACDTNWDGGGGGNPPAGTKRMYALRTNPNRLKSCRVCENCGKEFLSWKSFLEHGKCSSDDEGAGGDDSLASSPRSDADDYDQFGHAGWSKGKRSRRSKAAPPVCPSSEEEDLANCLVMLSAARVDPMVVAAAEPEESCASASKDEDRRQHHHIIQFSISAATAEKSKAPAPQPQPATAPRGMFECKACRKVFTSHQALGGHRASHKKVKGCFAANLGDVDDATPPEEDALITHDNHNNNSSGEMAAAAAMAMAIVPFDNPPLAVAPLKKKAKVHECSICHRVFTSGQALGGHKRCHWITSNAPDPTAVAKLHAVAPDHHAAPHHHGLTLRPMFESSSETLDLNLPAPGDEVAGARHDIGSPLRLEIPASVYLQQPSSWVDHSNTNNNSSKMKAATSSNNNVNNHAINFKDDNNEESNVNVEDEADSKVKLAKLSDLKDMNMGGESSPWLQVGIGSSANEGSVP